MEAGLGQAAADSRSAWRSRPVTSANPSYQALHIKGSLKPLKIKCAPSAGIVAQDLASMLGALGFIRSEGCGLKEAGKGVVPGLSTVGRHVTGVCRPCWNLSCYGI